MDRQTTFAGIEDSSRRRSAKREAFLEAMDAAIPRGELVAAAEPFRYPVKRGRRPIGAGRMLRMCFLQLRFGLSDEGAEDAVRDSRAFSRFMGVGFGPGDRAPDAATLPRFRRIIERNGLAAEILAGANAALEAKGVMMRGGSIADATFVEAPSSTKNASGSRDPETHRGKKGKSRHFGMRFALASVAMWSRAGRPELPAGPPA